MSQKKQKKSRNIKKYYYFLLPSLATGIFLALLGFILWSYAFDPKVEVYLSSENPKQGDTVLIKVSGIYPEVTGAFNNKSLTFFRSKKYSDWSAILGIDADMKPEKYKVIVAVPGKMMEKEINVEKKDFPSAKMVVSKELKNKGFTEEKVASNITKNDNPVLNKVFKNFTPQPYFTGAFSFPLQDMQKSGFDFGEIIKFTDYQIRHFGTDLKAGLDTDVHAINDGKVVLAKELSNYGKTVVVDHGLGIFSLYLHLDQFEVFEGQYVKNGQIVGLSGKSGYAAGPHLHFSIRDNGSRIDPVSFIKESEKASQNSGLASIREAFLRVLNAVR